MKTLLLVLLLCVSVRCRGAVALTGVGGEYVTTQANSYTASSNFPFTVSMWLKVTGDHQNTQCVLASRISGASGWSWQLNNGDYFQMYCYATSAIYRNSTAAITRNKWQNVVMTWTGGPVATGIKFYVDGVETGYGTTNHGGIPVTQPASIGFYFGNKNGDGGSLNGHMAEIAIWTNVLTVAEISVLGNRVAGMPLHVRKQHLIGYWPMNNGPDGLAGGGIGPDLSGNNDHATVFTPVAWRGSQLTYP